MQPDPLLCCVLFDSYMLWPEPRQLPLQLFGQPPAMPLTPGQHMVCKWTPGVIMGCLMNLPWGPRDVRLLWTAAQGLQLWVSGNSSYSSSDAGMHDVPSLPAEQHVLFERSQHAAAAVQY